MDLNQYEEFRRSTEQYNLSLPKDVYAALGLVGEAGEVADKIKKQYRDSIDVDDDIILELGDCLWYLCMLANELNMSLEDIMERNVAKLKDRQKRGTIGGSGDHR